MRASDSVSHEHSTDISSRSYIEMSTSATIMNGALMVSSGKEGNAAQLVKLQIPCDISNAAGYGVADFIFNNGDNSVSAVFPNALRLEVQLDFHGDNTAAKEVKVPVLCDWLRKIVKNGLGSTFRNICEIHFAMTDATHRYEDSEANAFSALGTSGVIGGNDDPVKVILDNRGCLVQVGVTGY